LQRGLWSGLHPTTLRRNFSLLVLGAVFSRPVWLGRSDKFGDMVDHVATGPESHARLDMNIVRREAGNIKRAEAETVADHHISDVGLNFRQAVGVDELF
jgi:hypothetical protein